MIELRHLSKTFKTKESSVQAVQDVSLTIEDGEIFGIIGYSGAGKSTLVRCLNMLERPETGDVIIDGIHLGSLNERSLRKTRKKIGMIFQHFNLLSSRTVYENIAFPLRYQGLSKKVIAEKASNLLALVGLNDKRDSYPSQLSGGQKQRVAIARSLANDPDILLCDEATSALDPQTTDSILKLLQDINKRLNLTVVIITHEMRVIKQICDRVAVMENGRVVELDQVVRIFAQPQQAITKDFISTVSTLSRINTLIEEKAAIVSIRTPQQLLRLDFKGESTKEAIISEISKQFNTTASIIFANVEIIQHTILGTLVVILDGDPDNQKQAIQYLDAHDIRVEVLNHA